ncbi:inovirus Gp2 family protein [Pseudomonas sp. CCM 7891]|uniref:Inovirus Gp2 family protein n=1 Tax=Pseudomonas karstica TaxID=1055468 RepID=A0A7X2RVR7_9PSED|nr:inovirus-type Gp2 protein [Pseudomonas karstica]MTD22022.1 inovirus Gp2 family protein [Pseudomonas karstica]
MSDKDNERYRALMSKIGMHVEGVGVTGGVDPKLICTLKEASSLLRRLMVSEGDAFGLSALDESGNACLEYNAPGKMLLKLLKLHIPNDSRFNALYKFEPYIEMAMDHIKEFGLYPLLLTWWMQRSASEAQMLMKHFNDYVHKIRQEVKSARFLSRLNGYQRSSNKNYKELTEYVDALFEHHARLLVLRVDLSYSKENSKTTQAQAKRDRERLFENARSNKLFGDMLGYIWKLEHGPEKGFHYHMMFFFDGSKVREDVNLAKRIGEYWKSVVTKGRGLYYNCNASKWRYEKRGIGMVNYGDDLLREGLQAAVFYLTKTDLYMKLQTVGRGMGKGNRPSGKGSRGRPRAI